ncbi:MAG: glycosyltransferase family 4 protein [Bacteroidales bacterium]|nr:glycosyltransferase family 4 protein [Bacteroidales bacterium]
MKIAIYYPKKFPAFSIKIYTDILIEELAIMGVEFVKFTNFEAINQEVDLIWDTQTGGGNPTFLNKKYDVPTVITMHGAALFSLPIKDNIYKLKTAFRIILNRNKYKKTWDKKINFIDKTISVSEFGKTEAIKYLKFPKNNVIPIYHGVNQSFYLENGTSNLSKQKIFLHISQFQPKKNLDRIIKAFIIANKKISSIKLKIICPGYPKTKNIKNIEIINTYTGRNKIAEYYQNSYAFIFPSLHETFGLPILEAMASGLPVITSKTTACGEIAGENSILVNPHSISEISNAIIELGQNEELAKQLSIKGIEYSKKFTWKKSAQEHLSVFKSLIQN